jgi:hypothetical protein
MNEQAKMEAEIAKLETELRNAKILDEEDLSTEAVRIGSKVKLYDMDFEHPNSDGSINPAFFRASMKNGIVIVPDWDSEEVRK